MWVLILVFFVLSWAPPAGAQELPPGHPPISVKPEDVVRAVMDFLLEEYGRKVTSRDLLKGAIKGMLESLGDPYSYYMDEEELRHLEEETEGRYGGIGAVLESRQGKVVIQSVIPGSPADLEGLKAGDVIVAVGGEKLAGMTLDQAVKLIRGEPGTEVELSIERPGLPTLLRIKIKRALVTLPTVDTQFLPGNFAYIRIHSFEASTVGERFRYIYERWVKVGARGIVVDLRSNPGGQLSQAVEVAQALVPRGPIVHIQDLSSGSKVTIDTLPHPPGPPLAVLVDEGTASAAEIVAAAVKENGAGVVVGRKTFGKSSVQTIIPLPVGGALRLTTARYLTPQGNSLDGRGLEPDVEVPATPLVGHSFPEMGKRTLRRGMVGLDVLGLQERLSFLGYDPGPLDGVFGRRTALALVRFQQEEGVQGEQWGVASGPTFSALESAVRRKLEALARDGSDLILERALGVLKEKAAR